MGIDHPLSNKELGSLLQKLPPDALVYHIDGGDEEYDPVFTVSLRTELGKPDWIALE